MIDSAGKTVEPWPVHGGWRVAETWWFFNKQGDRDQDWEFVTPELYATFDEAVAACAALRSRSAA